MWYGEPGEPAQRKKSSKKEAQGQFSGPNLRRKKRRLEKEQKGINGRVTFSA